MKHSRLFILGLALISALALVIPQYAAGAPLATVTNCGNDTDLRSQLTSLQSAGGGTLTFNCGTATVTLTNTLPDITKTTVIDGGGKITLSGNNAVSILRVSTDVEMTLKNIILEKGFGANAPGGAILNEGFLTLDNAKILDSHTPHDGGAIANFRYLEIKNSTLSNNSATNGGAVYGSEGLSSSASVKISASKFFDNTAAQDMSGGAILARSPIEISGSQFARNKAGHGGALAFRFIAEPVSVRQSSFSENKGIGDEPHSQGGAVFVEDSTLDVQTSRLESNEGREGGGIYVHPNGKLTVTETTFYKNFASAGGGLLNRGNTTLTNVTFEKNQGLGGGAIMNESALSLINATLSGNESLGGGGLMNMSGSASLTNVTFSENRAALGAGGAIWNEGETTVLTLKNVIAGNSAESTNCILSQAPLSSEFNLSSDNSCEFGAGRDNLNLKLGALANNGGSTQTHLPQADSPAVNGGDNGVCPAKDQRGVTRPQGSQCDVGAVEVPPTSPTPTPTATPTVQPCQGKPSKPALKKPANQKEITQPKAKLNWLDSNCATKYKVVVRLGSPQGPKFQQKGGLTISEFKTKPLLKSQTFAWRVIAANSFGKSKSDWRTFSSK